MTDAYMNAVSHALGLFSKEQIKGGSCVRGAFVGWAGGPFCFRQMPKIEIGDVSRAYY